MKSELNPILVQERLRRQKIAAFTTRAFGQLFNVSRPRAKHFLEHYTQAGLFWRLKRGIYTLAANAPDEKIIANLLYQPSYLSLEYALAYYHLIPETVYQITSVTAKPTRLFEVGNKSFSYQTIKTAAFTGYLARKSGPDTFLIAEPEKALVDYLYFVSLGKKTLNERLNAKSLRRAKLLGYAKLYHRPSLETLIKNLR